MYDARTDPNVASAVTAAVEGTAGNQSDISKIQWWMSDMSERMGRLQTSIDHVFFKTLVVTCLSSVCLSFLTTVLTVKWLLK